MDTLVQWIISNKEWLFSGLGMALVTAFIGIFVHKKNVEKAKIINHGKKNMVI